MSATDAIGPRRVAAVGTFDGVHLGHQLMIRQVCSLGADHGLCPAIFSFGQHPLSVIAPRRAPRMLTTVDQRCQLITGYGAREVFILTFDQELRTRSSAEFLGMLYRDYAVDMLVVGFNHRFGHNSTGSFEDYRRIGMDIGITLIRAEEYTDAALGTDVNSSAIRRIIAEGDIPLACRLLGHSFTIRGRVVRGHGIGHTIGYPTANIQPLMTDQQLPKPGVYAAMVRLSDGSRLPAMLNIGTNPTLRIPGQPLTVEANVIGYSGDLYGSMIELTPIQRLRDELRFDTLSQLTAQLDIDRAATLQIINNK